MVVGLGTDAVHNYFRVLYHGLHSTQAQHTGTVRRRLRHKNSHIQMAKIGQVYQQLEVIFTYSVIFSGFLEQTALYINNKQRIDIP
jgi:hypothetical protein